MRNPGTSLRDSLPVASALLRGRLLAAARLLRQGEGGSSGAGTRRAPRAVVADSPESGSFIACALCLSRIADGKDRIVVDGAHLHTFINPEGMIFKVRCFARAEGALGVGERSDHWTWFPGFSWQVALCRACTAHLGWRFAGESGTFVALIAERVIEQREPAP